MKGELNPASVDAIAKRSNLNARLKNTNAELNATAFRAGQAEHRLTQAKYVIMQLCQLISSDDCGKKELADVLVRGLDIGEGKGK